MSLRAALLTVSLCLFAPAVHAQTPNEAEGRRLFTEGTTALRALRYADAVSALERSLQLNERPSVLYNLGLAYRGINRCRDATAVFTRFLPTAGTDDERREVQTLLDELRQCPAHVTLQVRGESEEVLVDGARQPTRDGTHPLTLDPGEHLFEARRAGFRPTLERQTLSRGATVQLVLDASATPMPSTIAVETGDPAAVVRIDGTALSLGTTARETVAGEHRVEVEYPGHPAQSRAVRVGPGARLVVSFTDRGPAASGSGSVLTRWWFWTGVGVVAAGVVVGAVLATSGSPDPYEGTWGNAVARITVGP
jgi:hypothetical protein